MPTYTISPPFFLTKSKREANKKSIAIKKNGTARKSISIEGVRKESKSYALTSATSTKQNGSMMSENEML